jgi:hypothetical protein
MIDAMWSAYRNMEERDRHRIDAFWLECTGEYDLPALLKRLASV